MALSAGDVMSMAGGSVGAVRPDREGYEESSGDGDEVPKPRGVEHAIRGVRVRQPAPYGAIRSIQHVDPATRAEAEDLRPLVWPGRIPQLTGPERPAQAHHPARGGKSLGRVSVAPDPIDGADPQQEPGTLSALTGGAGRI